MPSRRFIAKSLSVCIFAVVLLLMGTVLFRDKLNWVTFRRIEQRHLHGELLNATNHPIQIIESKRLHTLPPGKTGMDIGIYDTDGFMIDSPTRIDKNVYNDGVFKICDSSRVTIRSTPEGDQMVTNKGTWVCRATQDYGFFANIADAFGHE